MSGQEPGYAGCRRPWRRLSCKKIAGVRKTKSPGGHQPGRENMRLLQCRHLFTQVQHVAAEGIERRSGEVVAVVDGVDSRKRIPLREIMVHSRSPKILSNRLQRAAEDFRDPAKVRCACWRRGPQIQKRLNARHGCRPRSRVRHEGCGRLMQVLPEPFVVAEEKRLVLLDRPSPGI